MSRSIGFIGAGQMARALAVGFLKANKVDGARVAASDVVAEARTAFEAATGCRAVENNHDVVTASEVLILAVKPQVMDRVLADVRSSVTASHLVVSIAAGVSLQKLSVGLGADKRLVRVMPNTPCLVGAAACGFTTGGAATQQDADYVAELLSSVGVAFHLAEPLLDAVTGLSGSGPAYVYQFIEALSDGGVRNGLPRSVATALAAQTVLGAAKMVLETGRHPGELKDMVASPGGTTIAGLTVLEQRAVRGAVIDAVTEAARRSQELATG